jgi:hypothetical protein
MMLSVSGGHIYTTKHSPTFRRTVLPPSSEYIYIFLFWISRTSGSFHAFVNFYQTVRRYIPYDSGVSYVFARGLMMPKFCWWMYVVINMPWIPMSACTVTEIRRDVVALYSGSASPKRVNWLSLKINAQQFVFLFYFSKDLLHRQYVQLYKDKLQNCSCNQFK